MNQGDRKESPDSIMDMDPRCRWEFLFNYLNEMAVILRRIEKKIDEREGK